MATDGGADLHDGSCEGLALAVHDGSGYRALRSLSMRAECECGSSGQQCDAERSVTLSEHGAA